MPNHDPTLARFDQLAIVALNASSVRTRIEMTLRRSAAWHRDCPSYVILILPLNEGPDADGIVRGAGRVVYASGQARRVVRVALHPVVAYTRIWTERGEIFDLPDDALTRVWDEANGETPHRRAEYAPRRPLESFVAPAALRFARDFRDRAGPAPSFDPFVSGDFSPHPDNRTQFLSTAGRFTASPIFPINDNAMPTAPVAPAFEALAPATASQLPIDVYSATTPEPEFGPILRATPHTIVLDGEPPTPRDVAHGQFEENVRRFGVLTPLTVYETLDPDTRTTTLHLVHGRRRLVTARVLQLPSVPVRVVQNWDRLSGPVRASLALSENVHHAPTLEAMARAMASARAGYASIQQCALAFGIPAREAMTLVLLAELDASWWEAYRANLTDETLLRRIAAGAYPADLVTTIRERLAAGERVTSARASMLLRDAAREHNAAADRAIATPEQTSFVAPDASRTLRDDAALVAVVMPSRRNRSPWQTHLSARVGASPVQSNDAARLSQLLLEMQVFPARGQSGAPRNVTLHLNPAMSPDDVRNELVNVAASVLNTTRQQLELAARLPARTILAASSGRLVERDTATATVTAAPTVTASTTTAPRPRARPFDPAMLDRMLAAGGDSWRRIVALLTYVRDHHPVEPDNDHDAFAMALDALVERARRIVGDVPPVAVPTAPTEANADAFAEGRVVALDAGDGGVRFARVTRVDNESITIDTPVASLAGVRLVESLDVPAPAPTRPRRRRRNPDAEPLATSVQRVVAELTQRATVRDVNALRRDIQMDAAAASGDDTVVVTRDGDTVTGVSREPRRRPRRRRDPAPDITALDDEDRAALDMTTPVREPRPAGRTGRRA